MKINVRDLTSILENNLKLYKESGQAKNLYFLFNHDLIVDGLIKDWLEEKRINYILNQYPNVLWEENKQGFLQKTEPPVYVVNSIIQDKAKQPFVFYFQLINYGRDYNGDNLLIDLISERTPNNANFHNFDLTNRMFTIASGFKKESANKVGELKPQLEDLFEIYEVDIDFQYILNSKLKSCLQSLDYYKSMNQLNDLQSEHYKENQDLAEYIQKLIDSRFNIDDSGVYFINIIDSAAIFQEAKTFEEFVKNLIDSLEDELKLDQSGLFRSSDKIINDYKLIIDWLKKF